MRVGDRIKMTTLTHGEAVFDRKGKSLPQSPIKDTYGVIIQYIGPASPISSAEVVRCSGGNVGPPSNEHAIHLQKTLCAMRWIMMMNGNQAVADSIEQDMTYIGDTK